MMNVVEMEFKHIPSSSLPTPLAFGGHPNAQRPCASRSQKRTPTRKGTIQQTCTPTVPVDPGPRSSLDAQLFGAPAQIQFAIVVSCGVGNEPSFGMAVPEQRSTPIILSMR
jgi:hypothetical protein